MPSRPLSPSSKKPAVSWRGRPVLDVEQVRALYLQGLSARQVAAQLGRSHSRVWRICKGLTRDRVAALRLAQPMRPSTHWRTCRAQARKIMKRKLGCPLLRHEEVHHKDEDFTNNAEDNLEVIWSIAHRHLHCPPNPVPRHLRPARQAYMKTYLAAYRRRHAG